MKDIEAVRRALARLVESGELRAEQVEPVSLAVGEALRERGAGNRVRWSEILAYVGGGLVLAGAAAFVGLGWDRMTQPTKITVLAVISLLLLAVAAGLGWAARSATGRTAAVQGRVAATLAVLGSGGAALCAGVAADSHEGLVAGTAGLVVAAVAYAALPTAIGMLAWGGFALLTLTGLLDALVRQESGWGLAYVALGVVILALALAGLLQPRDLGLGMGAVIALFGGQWPFLWDGDAWGYWLTAAIALACLALYGRWRTWVLIVSGVAGLTLAVPEAVWDWTDGAVGGAVILVLAGVVLLAASGLGIVLHRRAPQP